MPEKHFELNEQTMSVVEEIGQHMPGGFYICRDDNQKLLFVNRAVLDIYGCETLDQFRELTGFSFRGMPHPEDYASVIEAIRNHSAPGAGYDEHVEYRIVRRDGTVRWVDDYGHRTRTEAYGDVHYVFISDVTEKRVRMESDLAVRQAVIETLSEAYSEVWLITDVESETFSIYRTGAEGTAADAPIREAPGSRNYSQAKESCIRATVVPEDQARLREELALPNIVRKLQERPRFSVSYRRRMDDGSDRCFRVEFAAVKMPGGRMGVVCGFRDADAEVREAQEHSRALSEALAAAEQASRAKSAFLSNMSHEIRTPLNAIIGLSSIARKSPQLPQETAAQLEQIGESARQLLDIVNDILDMRRIESGRMAVRSEEFSFTGMLEQVNAVIGSRCRDKGLRYGFRTGGRLGDRYIGDGRKLRQVLVNLLDNAVKSTPREGSVTFAVEEAARFDRRATFRFTVSDTGAGIDGDDLPRLFDALPPEAPSAAGGFGGAGLSLSITRSLVELMNGSLEVRSEKGAGTAFTVTVTLAEAAEEAAPQPESGDGEEAPRAELAGRRVLVAEDVPINAEILLMVLDMQKVTAEHAENGRRAVEMFAASAPGHYDAVLMDIRMPEMDGLEATRAIRAMDRPDAGTIPIIALTANAFDEDVQRSMQAGLNAHLSKPVQPEELFRTLEKLIGSGR